MLVYQMEERRVCMGSSQLPLGTHRTYGYDDHVFLLHHFWQTGEVVLCSSLVSV